MNALRRTAVLLGLITTVMIGSSIPASATFSDSVSTPTGTMTTALVTAPTSVTVTASCTATTMTAVVTWPATDAPRVSYALTAVVEGTTITGQASQNRYEHSMPRLHAAHTAPVSVTVTAQTPYGWNAKSAALTAWVTTC